ncbi:hypothetical protein CQA43_08535 [Helicobacter ganmani]|uniref:Uncharacterized protein n=1 Tax=Helicobacter ganmani TaxID=60246 RepID=A0A3D8I9D1_9HELI|nr:hypothetical protein CQA43_08535 [Helicobacter ganmani]
MLGFQYLFLFAILAFRALLFVYDWFISKIINFIVKHFYIASVLLDLSLIVIIKYIKIYGFNHFWLYFFVGSFGYAFLMYNFGLFYFFLSEKLMDLKDKLKDLAWDLKFGIEKLAWKIRFNIAWKLLIPLKRKIKFWIDDIKLWLKWKIKR